METVTYREFLEKANQLYMAAEAKFSFFSMLMSPQTAIWVGGIIWSIFMFILFAATDKEEREYMLLFRLSNQVFLLFFAILFFLVSSIMFSLSWVHAYHNTANANRAEIDKYYHDYMETQDSVQYTLTKVITEDTGNYDAIDHDSYLFQDYVCDSCIIKTVIYQTEKNGVYQRARVILNYSLEPGKMPYMVTKNQIRENVAHIQTSGLYSPVIYLPKTEGLTKP